MYRISKNLVLCSLALLMLAAAPAVFAQPAPDGLWEFNDASNLTQATIGADLELVGDHTPIDGIEAGDGAVRVHSGSYYRMAHGTEANGGGSYLNQYTLVFDFKVPVLGVWYSFYQTNEANANDGEAFVNPNGNIGVGATGYSTVAIEEDVWYRLAIAIDLAAGTITYYLNGTEIQQGTGLGVDGRFSGYTVDDVDNPWILLFADDDGDDADIDVSTVMFFGRTLTGDEVAALQGPLGQEAGELPDPDELDRPSLSVSPTNPSGLDSVTLNLGDVELRDVWGSTWQVALDEDFELIYVDLSRALETVPAEEDLVRNTLETSYFAFGWTYYARANWSDENGIPSPWSNTVSFTMSPGVFDELSLIFLEDFEDTPTFGLPDGWETFHANPERPDPPAENDGSSNFYNPELQSWTVVEYDYLLELPWYPTWDDKAANPPGPVETHLGLIDGKSIHADTANFDSATNYYEAHLLSPEFDLTGVTDVHIAFNSNYVQNQDNIAVLEYTLDGGSVDMPDIPPHGEQPERVGEPIGTWHPVIYYLDLISGDVLLRGDGTVDAAGSLLQIAPGTSFMYDDYVFARENYSYEELSPFISPRRDDFRMDGKRFERFRIPQLDDQPSVRFRWMMMGTYSWYWGFDDFQIWGVSETPVSDWSLY